MHRHQNALLCLEGNGRRDTNLRFPLFVSSFLSEARALIVREVEWVRDARVRRNEGDACLLEETESDNTLMNGMVESLGGCRLL